MREHHASNQSGHELPYIVSLDAVLAPSGGARQEPIIKRVPGEEVLGWSFGQLVEYMLSAQPDQYNEEGLTLAEQNLAERLRSMLDLSQGDKNVALQLFVPDSGEGIAGPFTLSQRLNGNVTFVESEEHMPTGESEPYRRLELRATLYDIGGAR